MAEKMDTAQENQYIIHSVMFRKWVQETFLEALGSHVCTKLNPCWSNVVSEKEQVVNTDATDLPVIT